MKDYTIYVTEEIAKKAMEKGFEFDDGYYDGMCIPTPEVPTAEQICGWLREEKGIIITIINRFNGDYNYYGYACKEDNLDYGKFNCGNNYNEVMLEIINKAFELL